MTNDRGSAHTGAWIGVLGAVLAAAITGVFTWIAATNNNKADSDGKAAATVTVTAVVTRNGAGAAASPATSGTAPSAARPVQWSGRAQLTYDALDLDLAPPAKVERFDPTGDFTLVGYYPPDLDASVKSLATWSKKDDPSPADCESRLTLHEFTDQGSLPLTAGGGFCFRTKDNQGGHLGFLRILTAKNADKNGAQMSAVVWGPADGD